VANKVRVCCSAIKEQEEQAAMARFQKRSSKLHHLLSTSAVAGIYRSPYQALTNTVPVLDKSPLEDQIRASRKSLVSVCWQPFVKLVSYLLHEHHRLMHKTPNTLSLYNQLSMIPLMHFTHLSSSTVHLPDLSELNFGICTSQLLDQALS